MTSIAPNFHIETDLPPDVLLERLKVYEPWRIGVSFSNGVNTADLRTMQPFSDIPLMKLKLISEHCGVEWLGSGLRVLDIGSNIGYNSIVAQRDFNCDVTGLEFNKLNIEKAKLMADLCKVDVQFKHGDAGVYCVEEEFDLILHLGTLYHLPDPVGALKCAALSLKPGGRIYIESAVYRNEDEYACRYLHGFGGDFTNYWALSPSVVLELLEKYGLQKIEMIREFQIGIYEGTGMSRAFFFAEKAP